MSYPYDGPDFNLGNMSDQHKGPDTPSSEYNQMKPYWDMVEAINGGAAAMRTAGELYLPKLSDDPTSPVVGESTQDYKRRRQFAPFTNIYRDISRNLASKPFSREVKIKDPVPPQFADLCEDIDAQGNHFHIFAGDTFQAGLDKGIDWILVEYTKAPLSSSGKVRSIAEERSAGLRPYWIHIPAERLIAVYSEMVDGKEQVIHARIREDCVERDGWGEVTKSQIRVYDRKEFGDGKYAPATYEVYEKQTDNNGIVTWPSIEGPSPVTIGVIPLVPFIAGKRMGSSCCKVVPPLSDIAYLQIEEYQQESNLKTIMEQSCYPMLAANGISNAPVGEYGGPLRVPVGPRAVLFAPPDANGKHGEWKSIEPSSESLKTLMSHLDATQKNMRDLGMAPVTQANLTVITTANVAKKAQSQLQKWAMALKDTLEQAFIFTEMWLKLKPQELEVDIYTDFGVELGDDTDVANIMIANRDGVLSKQTTLEELKRRSFLSENLDVAEEMARLSADRSAAITAAELAINPVTGELVTPTTRPQFLDDAQKNSLATQLPGKAKVANPMQAKGAPAGTGPINPTN